MEHVALCMHTRKVGLFEIFVFQKIDCYVRRKQHDMYDKASITLSWKVESLGYCVLCVHITNLNAVTLHLTGHLEGLCCHDFPTKATFRGCFFSFFPAVQGFSPLVTKRLGE